MKESQYILYRKIKGWGNRILFYICGLLPIKKNRFAICTYEGKGGFGCNPKYIVKELHQRNPEYEFVWIVDDLKKEMPDYIKKVPNNCISRAYYLSTSKIWIDNYRKPLGTRKRRGQYYFQTWHGTIGFKSTGLLRGDGFSKIAYMVSKNDSDMIDFVTVDSKWFETILPKGLLYDGASIKTGAPRCDILYGDKTAQREAFRLRFHLQMDDKIVLFAPTFRESSQNGVRSVFSETWSIDFARLIRNLEKKFGGRWRVCIRVHPQLAAQMQENTLPETGTRLIDISQDDDMYENLAAMDALITDYSCVAMDAGFSSMPVFIYADDIAKYANDRGGMLFHLTLNSQEEVHSNRDMVPGIDTVLPYSIAKNNDELEKNILSFDQEEYQTRVKRFAKDTELIFDGKASKRAADQIIKYADS